MIQRNILPALALTFALAAAPALAAEDEHKDHHPSGTSAAAAQQPGMGQGMPGGTGMMGGMPMMGMMRGMMESGGMPMMHMMQGHVEGRLAFLKTELKITDAQLSLWNAVADAIRANTKSGPGMMGGMGMGMMEGKLPDRLAAQEKVMVEHLEGLRKFKTAVDQLYAALSDDQKKTADELLMGPMGMM
jgi:hypothetical protein